MWPEAFLLPFDDFSGPLSVPVLLLLYSLYPMGRAADNLLFLDLGGHFLGVCSAVSFTLKIRKKKCYNVL